MHIKISVQWARKGHLQCKSTAFLLYKCQRKRFKTAENWSVTNCLEKAELQFCVRSKHYQFVLCPATG